MAWPSQVNVMLSSVEAEAVASDQLGLFTGEA